jgi:hypothetical protein
MSDHFDLAVVGTGSAEPIYAYPSHAPDIEYML